jgi:hypothetical protein
MMRRLKQVREIVRQFEELALAVFGLVMLLVTMWGILKAHLP